MSILASIKGLRNFQWRGESLDTLITSVRDPACTVPLQLPCMFPHLPPYGGDVQPACVHLLQFLHRLDERVSGNQPKQKLLFGYQGREGVAM